MASSFQRCCFVLLLTLVEVEGLGFFSHRKRWSGGFNGAFEIDQALDKNDDVPEYYFTQKLDHFNPAESRTWQQRYFKNDTVWVRGGPVFLLLGGEGPIGPWYTGGTVINEYAERLGGLILGLEHRFYGKSNPTADMSLDSLQYLSSEQALADLALFRIAMGKELDTRNSAWVVVGGSYPGCLSAWAREKYPDLFVGSLAVSAPVRAKEDFFEYDELVERSLGPHCAGLVRRASDAMDELLDTEAGRALLVHLFGICPGTLATKLDLANFQGYVAGDIMGAVQYNRRNSKYSVHDVCATLAASVGTGPVGRDAATKHTPHTGARVKAERSRRVDEEAEALVRALAAVAKRFEDPTQTPDGCIDVSFAGVLHDLARLDFDNKTSDRQWYWQTCSEFGFYQTAEGGDQPFSERITLAMYKEPCRILFDRPHGPHIKRTNREYGAEHLKASNILFTNGRIDPWHALSVLHNVSQSVVSVVMDSTSHCSDLARTNAEDAPELTAVRALTFQMISSWIADAAQHQLPSVPSLASRSPVDGLLPVPLLRGTSRR